MVRQHRGCRLIVIDNLENYCDSPRQLRQAIQELDELAIYLDIAIVAIVQDNVRCAPDGTIRDTARTTDGPAGCIWCLTADAARPGLLRLEPKRMTICKKPEGIACRISDSGQALWEPLPPYEKPPTEAARRKQQEQARMRTWLETTLGAEIVRSDTIYDAGKEQGFSKNKLIAARNELGARTFKTGFGKTGVWMWTLKPQSEVNEAEVQIASIGLPPAYFDELQEARDAEFPDDEEVDVQLSHRASQFPPQHQTVPIVVVEEVFRGRLNSIRQAEAGKGKLSVERAYELFEATVTAFRQIVILRIHRKLTSCFGSGAN